MIPRYTPGEFSALWSADRRYATWLEIELVACEELQSHGAIPHGTAESIRAMGLRLDAGRIEEIETHTRHDVIAFLTHVEELAGPPARWLHRGLTSSDVLDTAFAITLRDAAGLCLDALAKLIGAMARRVEEHRKTVMIGRSHGIHAEPITFGLALAGHLAEFLRARSRLVQAREEISVGTLSGAVGTYAHLSPDFEVRALNRLGLRPETVPTQIVSRDRHAVFFNALAVVACAIERFAVQVRHWQRSEVSEVEEPFRAGQKGSSAMPHKRNPVLSENLCGLARMVRAYALAALEDTALWHERDISHSSAERMIGPDATTTLGFMLGRAAGLVDGLVVYPEKLAKNLESARELWASEAVLLALVDAGVARQEAYVWVQRSAMRTWAGEGSFRGFLVNDCEVSARVDTDTLGRCFSLQHALRNVDTVIDRVLAEV